MHPRTGRYHMWNTASFTRLRAALSNQKHSFFSREGDSEQMILTQSTVEIHQV